MKKWNQAWQETKSSRKRKMIEIKQTSTLIHLLWKQTKPVQKTKWFIYKPSSWEQTDVEGGAERRRKDSESLPWFVLLFLLSSDSGSSCLLSREYSIYAGSSKFHSVLIRQNITGSLYNICWSEQKDKHFEQLRSAALKKSFDTWGLRRVCLHRIPKNAKNIHHSNYLKCSGFLSFKHVVVETCKTRNQLLKTTTIKS